MKKPTQFHLGLFTLSQFTVLKRSHYLWELRLPMRVSCHRRNIHSTDSINYIVSVGGNWWCLFFSNSRCYKFSGMNIIAKPILICYFPPADSIKPRLLAADRTADTAKPFKITDQNVLKAIVIPCAVWNVFVKTLTSVVFKRKSRHHHSMIWAKNTLSPEKKIRIRFRKLGN